MFTTAGAIFVKLTNVAPKANGNIMNSAARSLAKNIRQFGTADPMLKLEQKLMDYKTDYNLS